jgi:hypothetical protein
MGVWKREEGNKDSSSTFRVLHVDQWHNVSLELTVLLLLGLRSCRRGSKVSYS